MQPGEGLLEILDDMSVAMASRAEVFATGRKFTCGSINGLF
jgi:hypothetical protein